MNDVEDQVEHDKENADKQHVGLNDRIVAIENGRDAEFSESGPGKNVFNDDGAGDQLRNTHADCRYAALKGVFQYVTHKNRSLLEAADVCIEHVVFTHVLEHVVADETDVG